MTYRALAVCGRILGVCGCVALADCAGAQRAPEGELTAASGVGQLREPAPEGSRVYVGHLSPLNDQILESKPLARVTFVERNENIDVTVEAQGLTPGAHFLSINAMSDRDSLCPTVGVDGNGDKIIDSVEASVSAGAPILFLNRESVQSTRNATRVQSIDSPEGQISFRQTMGRDALEPASALEQRTILLYGAPAADVEVPATVRALSGQSPRESIPIACGTIVRMR